MVKGAGDVMELARSLDKVADWVDCPDCDTRGCSNCDFYGYILVAR